jgi:hypothetical protein
MVAFGCFLPVGEDWVFLERLGDLAFFSLVIGVVIEIAFFAFRDRQDSEGNADVAEARGVRCILASLRGTPLIYIGIIMTLGLLSLTWFKGELIDGMELELPLSPSYNLHIVSYVWSGTFSRESAQTVAWLVPQASYYALMERLGFTVAISERLFFYVVFTGIGLSMFFMTSSLLKGRERYLAGFVSALFYMMNFWPMMFRWSCSPQELPVYMVTPLVFLFLAKGIEQRSGGWAKYALAIAFCTLISASNIGNPGYNISMWMIMCTYVVYSLLMNRDSRSIKHILKFFGTTLLIFVALNAWWFLPTALVAPLRLPTIYEKGLEGERTLTFIYTDTKYANLLGALRQLSHWSFFSGHRGTRYYLYSGAYETPLFIALSFLAPMLAFLAIFLTRKRSVLRYILFFASVSVIGAFLVKGIRPPFGEVFTWLFYNVPYPFRIFRMPHDKLGNWIPFGYAFLIGYSVATIYYRVSSGDGVRRLARFFSGETISKLTSGRAIAKLTTVLLLFLLFGVYMFPYWTGDLVYSTCAITMGMHVKSIPSYYYDAGNWFNSQKDDFKILTLPFRRHSASPGIAYTWGFEGGDPTKHIIFKPFITHAVEPPPIPLTNEIYDILHDNSSLEIGRYLGIMNVKYLLLHNDFAYSSYASNPNEFDPPQTIADLLESQKGIRLVKTFGELSVYQNDYYLPHVYATSNLILTSNFSARMWENSLRDFPEAGTPAIFPTQTSYLYSYFYSEFEKTNRLMETDLGRCLMIMQQAADGVVNNTGWEFLQVYGRREIGSATNGSLASYRIYFQASGNYTIYAHMRWDGFRAFLRWQLDEGAWSDRVSPYRNTTLDDYTYGLLQLGNTFVTEGNHTFTLMSEVAGSRRYQNLNYLVMRLNETREERPSAVVTSERIDPTKYKVHVNASAPFLLVFSEGYHPLWTAYYASDLGWLDSFWRERVSEQDHFLVNNYMNAWYINRTGEYDLVLYFTGQNTFYAGSIVSIVTFATGLIFLSRSKIAGRIRLRKRTKQTRQSIGQPKSYAI